MKQKARLLMVGVARSVRKAGMASRVRTVIAKYVLVVGKQNEIDGSVRSDIRLLAERLESFGW